VEQRSHSQQINLTLVRSRFRIRRKNLLHLSAAKRDLTAPSYFKMVVAVVALFTLAKKRSSLFFNSQFKLKASSHLPSLMTDDSKSYKMG
jgi:hypothetical protein